MGKPVSRSVVLASAMLALSSAAGAAGLGRLSVLSDLGQPLRAEIDVVAVEKDELESLSARLASIETYVQNNLPYPSPSMGLQLSLEMRQSGQPYIVATTVQPINEPFVDILVELTWNDGRILRGYTALIDPPTFGSDDREPSVAQSDLAPEIAPAPMAAPEPSVETQFGSELTQPAPDVEAIERTEPTYESAPEGPDRPAAEAAAQPGLDAADDSVAADGAEMSQPVAEASPATIATDSATDTHQVKRGETLSGIARQFVSEDVSLDQMLVLLVRTNPDAFVDGNMNRLKAGKVLQIPGGADAAAIDPAEARQVVRLQTADFNAYREKLAAAAAEAAGTPAAGQSASGSISAMVGDEAPAGAEQPKEVVKLSAGDGAADQGAKSARALEEELAAREKTIREQNERVAMLEKQVKDMQALLELRNEGMANVQQSAQTDAATVEPAPAAAAGQAATPDAAAPAAGPAAEAPAAAGVTEEPKPVQAKKPKVVAKPAPSFTDQLLDQPLYLAGGAAVLGLLGFLGFKLARKRKQDDEVEPVESVEHSEDVSATRAAETIAAEVPAGLASTGLPSTGVPPMSEDVDPLAEAEIYLAYGRDGQAEEILKEALQGNPRRHEIHLKLLEIYAKRKDAAAFDGVARELHMATGGQGEVWLQAARLGYPLDPQNPRYALGKPVGAEVAASAGASGAVEDKLDFDIGLDEPDAATKTDIDLSRLGAAAGTSTDVDLSNLTAGQNAMSALAQSTTAGMERTQQTAAMDLDLGADQGKPTGLDFDFDLNGMGSEPTDKVSAPVANAGAPGSMSFDLSKISLDEGALDKVEPRLDVGTASTPDIDLSSIDLRLDGGQAEGSVAGGAHDDQWYDVQTKFDLAKAYQEMGDKEGAREILREVIAEGDNEQQAAAQRVLETLA